MKELFGAITDIHLSDNNIREVILAVTHAIDECISREIRNLFIMGDIFTNRKALSFHTIQAFNEILTYIEDKEIEIHFFPGNHDKISYISEKSYLDVFRHFPKVSLYTDVSVCKIREYDIHILPFFDEKTALLPRLEKLKKVGVSHKSILLTHIAIDGVRNNDGSEVDGVVNRKTFSRFTKVLVGHYHDKQEIDNIIYIGSLLQNNYGENEMKGLTIVYEDFSLEQISVRGPQYLTVEVDLEKYSKKEVRERLIDIYKDTDQKVRFKLIGSQEQLKSINREEFAQSGIDLTYKEIVDETVTEEDVIEFNGFNRKKMIGEWETFCEKKEERIKFKETGKELLERIENE